MKSSKIDTKFLEYVLRELSMKKFHLNIHPSRRTPDGNYGTFDYEEKNITVALYADLGFNSILAHEFAHYKQFLKDPNAYQGYGILGDWISVRNEKIKNYTDFLSNETIEESCVVVLDCERDAEQFTVQTAEEWKFEDFNKSLYIQSANFYLWSIRHSFEYRQYLDYSKKDKKYLFQFMPSDRIISVFEACHLPVEWIEWWEGKKTTDAGKESKKQKLPREKSRKLGKIAK